MVSLLTCSPAARAVHSTVHTVSDDLYVRLTSWLSQLLANHTNKTRGDKGGGGRRGTDSLKVRWSVVSAYLKQCRA